MNTCNTNYISGVSSASGSEACQHIDTMISCLNTACTGCDDSVKQQFNAIVSPIQSGSSCQAGGACANSTICTAAEPLTCGESDGTNAVSVSLLTLCLVFLALVQPATSCDAAGMNTCNTNYISGVSSASGSEACEHIDTMISCMNTACTGCDDSVKQQFNAIVNPIQSGSSCQAGGACANSTICTAAEPLTCGESDGTNALSVSLLILAAVTAVLINQC